MATETSSTPDNTAVFQQLESYPWEKDAEFQGGLSAILGSATEASQVQELTIRAQVFYLSRKKSIPIDFDAYKTYLSSKNSSTTNLPDPSSQSTTQTQNENETETPSLEPQKQDVPSEVPSTAPSTKPETAPYPPTFSEIVALITSGEPIPGIVDVAPTLLTSQATKPVAKKRRKPWEKEDAVVEGKDGGIGGTFGDRRDDYIVQELPE